MLNNNFKKKNKFLWKLVQQIPKGKFKINIVIILTI